MRACPTELRVGNAPNRSSQGRESSTCGAQRIRDRSRRSARSATARATSAGYARCGPGIARSLDRFRLEALTIRSSRSRRPAPLSATPSRLPASEHRRIRTHRCHRDRRDPRAGGRQADPRHSAQPHERAGVRRGSESQFAPPLHRARQVCSTKRRMTDCSNRAAAQRPRTRPRAIAVSRFVSPKRALGPSQRTIGRTTLFP